MKMTSLYFMTLSILFLNASQCLANESPAPYASGNPEPSPYQTPMPSFSAPPMPMQTPMPTLEGNSEVLTPDSRIGLEAITGRVGLEAKIMDADALKEAKATRTASHRDWYGYDDMESTTPIKGGYFRNMQQQSAYFKQVKFLNSVKVQGFNQPADAADSKR